MTAGGGVSTGCDSYPADDPSGVAPWQRVPPWVIPRPRVDALIATGAASGPITALIAPIGFGKTIAIAQWAATCRCTAWVAVPVGADVIDLTSALRQSLRAIGRTPPDELREGSDPLAILWWAGASAEPITIVIDDLQLAQPRVIDALGEWADHPSRGTRLILSDTGRLMPALTPAVYRGDCTLITADDLAMTLDEVTETAAKLDPAMDVASCDRLHRQTRGWPATVPLALRDRSGSMALTNVFIESRILAPLSPRERDFVLATATSDSFDDDIAAALGFDDAAALRFRCARRGVPTAPAGAGGREFAWPGAITWSAREMLQRRDPAAWRRCNLVLGEMLADVSPRRALEHLLAGGDVSAAWNLLATRWIELAVDGDSSAVGRAVAALQGATGETSDGCWIRAACARIAGDPVGAQSLIARARRLPAASPVTAACARLIAADDEDVLAATVERLHTALDAGDVPAHTIPYVVFLTGWTLLRLRRDPVRAAQLLESAASQAEVCGRPSLARRARGNLAFAAAFAGSFGAARRILAQLTAPADTSDWQIFDDGVEEITDGFIRLWTNDFPGAQRSLAAAAAIGRNPGSYSGLARIYLALVMAERGSPAQQAEAFSDLDRVARCTSRGVPWGGWRQAGRAWLALALGEEDAAVRYAHTALTYPNSPIATLFCAIVLQRCGRPGEARNALTALSALPSHLDATRSALMALLSHDEQSAHALLEHALGVARQEGALFAFQAVGADLLPLLGTHGAWGSRHSAFLAQVLSAVSAHDGQRVLSRREREVLDYLRTPLTNDEIAREMSLSINTVKTHERAIYRKLRVANRREAVKAHT